MKQYTLGFIFNKGAEHILLITKGRPTWQAGLLNGLGGFIEPGESPLDCVRREVREEANLHITAWYEDFVMEGPGWRVYGFSAVLPTALIEPTQMTDEKVAVYPVSQVLSPVFAPHIMRNLPVLITICRDRSGLTKPVMLYDGIPNKPSVGDITGVSET
jgi:8-oxo-dGTP pyrophosphatase MutT (NUDIX family)